MKATGFAGLSPNSSIAIQTSPLGGCGACLRVTNQCIGDSVDCQPRSTIVQVVDTCATCSANTINLSEDAFQELGGDKLVGVLQITYSLTECTYSASTNITVAVTDYRASEGGWLRLAITNVRASNGLIGVELRQTPLVNGHLDILASSWHRLNNLHGATWELSGLPDPPMDLRITDGAGGQLVARKVIVTAGVIGSFDAGVQFPASNSGSYATATTAAALAMPELAALLLPTKADSMVPAVSTAAPAVSLDSSETTSFSPPGLPEGAFMLAPLREAAKDTADASMTRPFTRSNTNVAGSSSSCTETILSILASRPSFNTTYSLVEAAGLGQALEDPETPLTFFAPTDSAWQTAVQKFPLLRFDEDTLRTVCMQHILVGRKAVADFSPQLLRYDTLSGGSLSIKASGDGRLMVLSQTSAGVTLQTDMAAFRSIVHAIDSVLMPQLGKRRMRSLLGALHASNS